MLRSILLGVDGSEHSEAALGLAIQWARRFDALLVGMGCIDEPGLHGPEEYLVGEAYFDRLNTSLLAETRKRVDSALSKVALRCAEAGVAFKPLEDVGTPYAQILLEAQRYDLIVMGRQTHFRFGWQDEPDITLSKVLADSPRPVVAVRDEAVDGKTALIAYDGSLQASRALASFESSGLGRAREIHVASIAEDKKDAARRAERAVDFLKAHKLDAVPYPVETSHSPAEVLLETIRRCDPGLVVMGAYGQPILREFFLGSTTRTMLEQCPVPIFLDH